MLKYFSPTGMMVALQVCMGNWVNKTIKNQKGFSLVEAVLSSVVLGVGLLAGLLVFETAAANTLYSDFTTIATQTANQKLEEIMADKESAGYDAITEGNYADEDLTTPYVLQRDITIYEVSSADLNTAEPGSGLKKVEVFVCWDDCSDSHSVAVTTLLADY